MALKKPSEHKHEINIRTDVRGVTSTQAHQFSHADFELIIEATITSMRALAHVKGGEYAGDLDRLANFRRNGERLGLPMEVIWTVYFGKHYDSISQYIQDLHKGTARARAEPLSGRVDDMIVYLLLFKAMLAERGEP